MWKEVVVALNEYGRSSIDIWTRDRIEAVVLRPSVQKPSVTRRMRAVTGRVYLPRAQLPRDNTGIDLCLHALSVLGQYGYAQGKTAPRKLLAHLHNIKNSSFYPKKLQSTL